MLKHCCFKWIGGTFGVLLLWGSTLAGAASKPNVIVILTDDQGYADAGFQGFPASRQALTPNLDKLAASGTVFRNGYVASSTCGPSRQSLLSGRTSSRFGVEENGPYAAADEIFLPRALKGTGYATAMFGKWHCGDTEELSPPGRGFDEAYETSKQDFFMKKTPHPTAWKNGGMPEYGPYLTDAITDNAIEFIQKNKGRPFFAYVAHHAPHSPFCTKEQLMQRVAEHAPEYKAAFERRKTHIRKGDKGRPAKYDAPDFDFGHYKGKDLDMELLRLTYLSMLLAVDDGVGKILDVLEKEGLREKTLIFYLSDNGAALSRPNDLGGVNLPLRAGKGSVYDGGCRVPYVMSWPGTIPAGKTSELVVSSMDIFSTTVELAGGTVPSDRVIDGVNLMPYITGAKPGPAHEYLFFRRKGRNAWSIRSGDYKWVWNPAKRKSRDIGDPFLGPESNPEGGFYDIQNHVSEGVDLSSQFPERKEELISLYKTLASDLAEPRTVNGGIDEND